MNILKINCGLVLLDFLLKKSNHPTPNHILKPVKNNLLRKELTNATRAKKKKKDSNKKRRQHTCSSDCTSQKTEDPA